MLADFTKTSRTLDSAPNSRLYNPTSKSSYIEEIDRRLERLKVKLERAKRERDLAPRDDWQSKKLQALEEEEAAVRRYRLEHQAPFVNAFKAFGATSVHSKINSTEVANP